MIETVQVVGLCVASVSVGAMFGIMGMGTLLREKYAGAYKAGERNGWEACRRMFDQSTARNDLQKSISKPGSVPEMIAAGELAEVVEVMGDVRSNAICVGCRYAGRYLLPRTE